MTVALYARRKRLPLESVTVRLSHSRIHAADCAECETKAGRLDRVDWTLQFEGDLTDAQRTRLLEIAQMCPVHRTLRSEIHIPPPTLVTQESASDDSSEVA
jgi:putative redox protein